MLDKKNVTVTKRNLQKMLIIKNIVKLEIIAIIQIHTEVLYLEYVI